MKNLSSPALWIAAALIVVSLDAQTGKPVSSESDMDDITAATIAAVNPKTSPISTSTTPGPVSAAVESSPPPAPLHQENTEDVVPLEPAAKAQSVSASAPAAALLPVDKSAQPLPAAKSFAKNLQTHVWRDVPLSQALDEIARDSGLKIRLVLPEGTAPRVSGDFSQLRPREVVEALAVQARLSLNEVNGAITLSQPAQVAKRGPQQFLVSREFVVEPIYGQAFHRIFSKARDSVQLVLVSTDSNKAMIFRASGSPTALDSLAREYEQAKATAPRHAPQSDPKIAEERAKLLAKRRALVDKFIAQ
jgi:hypothetical protein